MPHMTNLNRKEKKRISHTQWQLDLTGVGQVAGLTKLKILGLDCWLTPPHWLFGVGKAWLFP